MKSLFIDTASSRIILALLEDTKVILRTNEVNDHSLSSRIFPLIDDLLNQAHWTTEDIKRIYVVHGPGSFTGIRVGVTIAKTYAWAKKLEIIPLSELELLATTDSSADYIVPYIDARRDAVYTGIYSKNGAFLEDCYMTIEELKNRYPEEGTLVSVSYDSCNLGIKQIEPNINLEKMIERHKNDIPMNHHEVNPMYLKQTEAEENLKK